MKKIIVSGEFFNIEDTLSCGQIFRFKPYENGFLIFSKDKACFARQLEDGVEITFNNEDENYFYNFFDLDRDYSKIYSLAVNDEISVVKTSASLGKGIRILNQDAEEMVVSFMVSQNNNIPRIKGILEKLCAILGEEKTFLGQSYYTFPSIEKLKNKSLEFYKSIGLGYRAEYIYNMAVSHTNKVSFEDFKALSTEKLKEELLKIKGIGKKVADCISLFGYHRADSFPVDTWIEKVYREDFNGTLTDREKIAEFFVSKYKENSGYIQQYLFYYKRSLENKR